LYAVMKATIEEQTITMTPNHAPNTETPPAWWIRASRYSSDSLIVLS